MKIEIAVIDGDGVGPEMMAAALLVLQAVSNRYGHELCIHRVLAAGAAIEVCGDPMPEASLEICQKMQAVLLGNTGLARYHGRSLRQRPEYALMCLRRELKVTTNIRPVKLYQGLHALSPLKEQYLDHGMDLLFVRDIAGGVFCSDKVSGTGSSGREAYEREYYNEVMISDTATLAFELAAKRRRQVTSLDKANVLESSRLWRRIVTETANRYPEITLQHSYVDAAAMDLMVKPGAFDVIVTSNLFGDIISDEGTQLTGVPNLYASAELAGDQRGIFTPNQLHQADESMIGRNIVNPVGMIASAALMLRYSFGLEAEAQAIEAAVSKVLKDGYVTADLLLAGYTVLPTGEMAAKIAAKL